MGEFKTVTPSTAEALQDWQEGLLVAARFRIVRFVGQGGMGKVYLAQDETLGRPIALKRIPQEIIFDGDARDDLRQEANRLLDLAHENIVRIHTYYDGPTWPFFAMEFLQGPTLKRLLRLRKQYSRTFSPAEVLRIARQVAKGLAYAHAKGVIHRDLKPGNLMLAAPPGEEIKDADVIKITDFGISRVIADSTMRQTGKRSGTLPYMSPEQFHGEPCTVQSDIYSLGCLLYELLCGKPPFHTGDLGYQILHVQPKPLHGVPKAMAQASLKALSKDPRQRFQTVEEFIDALEGKPRRTSPRLSHRALVLGCRIGLVAVACLALVLVAVKYGKDITGGQSARSERRDLQVESSVVPAEDTLERQRARAEFRDRVRAELSRQIPSVVGLNFPAARSGVSDGVPAISLEFVFPEPTGSNYQRVLFERLVLQCYSQTPKGDIPPIEGTLKEGKKTFRLDDLVGGTYTVQAYLVKVPGQSRDVEPLLENDPKKFTVDLTPPSFEIEPVNPGVFVNSELPVRTTFDDVVELQLRALRGPGDIADAQFQVVQGTLAREWLPIDNPLSWRVELPGGALTTYRVVAKDAAKNQTAAFEVSFRRLSLEVETFELSSPDGVRGNIASVRGVLRVEGDQVPSLKYFIGGAIVEPEESTLTSPLTADLNTIPFFAKVRLPAASNTIEVRYSWKDNPPRPFARPVSIADVKVRSPEISLAEIPPRTRDPLLALQGRVEPTFDGLDVNLDHRGRGNVKLLLQRVSPTASTFAQEVELMANKENTFRILCFYKNQLLEPTPPGISVTCDNQPPTLREPVRFEPTENLLFVTLFPLEELSLLRVREVSGEGAEGPWRMVEPDLRSLSFKYVTALPIRPATFQFELTDRVGNVETLEQYFTPGSTKSSIPGIATASAADAGPAGSSADTGSLDASSGTATSGTATSGAGSTGPGASGTGSSEPGASGSIEASTDKGSQTTFFSSPFVQELDMEFVPFWDERFEMARTEVSERAWFRFLRDRKLGETTGVGRLDFPMTMDDHSPELLRDFVKWFGEKSRDGYVYDVPTKEQWITAFCGVSGMEKAYEVISAWFQGRSSGEPRGFQPNPGIRYGLNKVSALGARKENRTPTGLLDMEANVQEVVSDGEVFKVIGGSNRLADPGQILQQCLMVRPYGADERTLQGKITGFRLCRRPAKAK